MKIKIFQINQDRDKNRVKFCGSEETERYQGSSQINASLYDEVFDGNVDCKDLDDIYTLFNTDHPPTHRGHSLSVSDVIATQYGYYFCESIGFKPVEFNESLTHKPDNLLRTVMVEPGKPAYEAEIQDSLKSLQRAVAGHIEVTYPFGKDLVVVSNELAKINDLPENRMIYGELYCGNFFIVGDNHEGDFCSLTDEQVAAMLERFSEPEFFEDESMDENQDSGIQLS